MSRMIASMVAVLLAVPVAAAQAAQPVPVEAWATSRHDVRVQFAEPVEAAAVPANAWVLSMAGKLRRVTRVRLAADGLAADLRAEKRWAFAAAGSLRLVEAPEDAAIRVWAAPGDTTAPRLSRVRVRALGWGRARAVFRLDEAAEVRLDVRRRRSSAASIEEYSRGRGRGTIDFGPAVEGRSLHPGTYEVTLTAVDSAGNESKPVTKVLRI